MKCFFIFLLSLWISGSLVAAERLAIDSTLIRGRAQLYNPILKLKNGNLVLTYGGHQGIVSFLQPDGQEIGAYRTEWNVFTPAQLSSHQVLVASNALYRFNSNGEHLRTHKTESVASSAPLVLKNGQVVTASGNNEGIVEFRDAKLRVRRVFTPKYVVSSLQEGADNTVVAQGRGQLYILSQDGDLLASFSRQSATHKPVISSKSGNIAWTSDEGTMGLYSSTGRVINVLDYETEIEYPKIGKLPAAVGLKSPFFLPDDSIVVLGENNKSGSVHFLDSRGHETNRFEVDGSFYTDPVRLNDGTVVVASDKIYFFRPNGKLKFAFQRSTDTYFNQLAVLSDGTLVAAEQTHRQDYMAKGEKPPNATVYFLNSEAEVLAEFETESEDVVSLIQGLPKRTLVIAAWESFKSGCALYLQKLSPIEK